MEKEVADILKRLNAMSWRVVSQKDYYLLRGKQDAEDLFEITAEGLFLLLADNRYVIPEPDLHDWAIARFADHLTRWSRDLVTKALDGEPIMLDPPSKPVEEITLPLAMFKTLLVSWAAHREGARQAFAQLLDQHHVSPLLQTKLLSLITICRS